MTEAVTPPNPADPSDSRRSIPDPTLLTIDALRREIAMSENLFNSRFDAKEELNKERLRRIDSLMEVREELNRERFRRIDSLMERAESMRQEQKLDTRAAVEAALEAQKEATHKMEKTVSEQITSLRANLDTAHSGLRESIADLKDRATIQESVKQGHTEQRFERHQVSGTTIAIITTVFAAILVVLAIVSGFAMGT